MVATVGPQLPRGRHSLTRDEVEESQRLRIVQGVAEAMRAKGFVATTVTDIIKLAGISRETFYQHHTNKLDAFLATVDAVGSILISHLSTALEGSDPPVARFERALTAYLDVLASNPGYARIVLVETSAAGPEAMARRADIQTRIVDEIARLFRVRSASGRFACEMLVASIGAMVTLPVVTGDVERIRGLGPPIIDQVRRWESAGVLAARSRKAPE